MSWTSALSRLKARRHAVSGAALRMAACALVAITPAWAQAPPQAASGPLPAEVEAALARAKLPREALSVLVVDAQGTPGARTPARLAHRAQVPVNPASVM